MSHIFSIEGNIGSGKSTLVKLLKEKCVNNKNLIFLDEPVDEWTKLTDEHGKNMIEKFYDNQAKYAFSFQTMAYITRLSKLRKALKSNPHSVIITERSLYTDKYVFAKMLFEDDKIEMVNYKLYMAWFDEFIQDIPETTFIYIKTNPEVCFNRIQIRARQGEENIELTYLEKCDQYHNDFIHEMKSKITSDSNFNVHTINGNPDISTNLELLNTMEILSKAGLMQTRCLSNMLSCCGGEHV